MRHPKIRPRCYQLPHGSVHKRYERITAHSLVLPRSLRPSPLFPVYHHGCVISATEGTRWHPLGVERDNRRLEPRQGNLKRHTSQGCLLLRQRSPCHDQSKRSLGPCRSTAGSLRTGFDGQQNGLRYVELGLACAGVCKGDERPTGGSAQSVFIGGDRATDYVSRANGDIHFARLADCTFDHRTVAEIERKVVKLGKRSVVSGLFHSKNDKERIAAWRLDLNRILHVFNVRSIISSPAFLTTRFQTELAINTHGAVVNTQNIVADIRRTIAERQEGVDGRNVSVSGYTISPPNKF